MSKTSLQVSTLKEVYQHRKIATPLIFMPVNVRPGFNNNEAEFAAGVLFHFISQGKDSIDFVTYSAFVNAEQINGQMKMGELFALVLKYFGKDIQGQVVRGHLTGIDLPKAVSADDITEGVKTIIAEKEVGA